MSFSSRRRNYLLTPHRRDGLIEWMKSMLQHSFVLDALETTADDTFHHFEVLIDEHRALEQQQRQAVTMGHGGRPRSSSLSQMQQQSRLKQLVPTMGSFHTPLPLREAFAIYNEKHRLTKRKHIQISFNEIRHILNLAQIIALRKNRSIVDEESGKLPDEQEEQSSTDAMASSFDTLTAVSAPTDDISGESAKRSTCRQLNGPRLMTFDGDQTLYSDGANFESNPRLAFYLFQLLRNGVAVAVVTAAGYEYGVEKYEYRLSGLLKSFQQRGLTADECARFYLFGGECNYLLQLGSDFRLHPVRETGPGGWCTSTKYLPESPGNWPEAEVSRLLDVAEASARQTLDELNLRGRIIRKRRAIGLIPLPDREITRESLDEAVLRVHEKLHQMNGGSGPNLPYCAFNGGSDAWIDVGNKRVGVNILQAYLGIDPAETLHIGDQFLNTGNDYAARETSPCVWIISPQETTYVLKSILRLAGVAINPPDMEKEDDDDDGLPLSTEGIERTPSTMNFEEVERRRAAAKEMDVYTGEMVSRA